MPLLAVATLGALIGLPFGYAMQRTQLCFNTAYRAAGTGAFLFFRLAALWP